VPRSIKKGPYIDGHLEKKVQAAVASNNRKPIKTWSRRSMVIPDMIGLTIVTTQVVLRHAIKVVAISVITASLISSAIKTALRARLNVLSTIQIVVLIWR